MASEQPPSSPAEPAPENPADAAAQPAPQPPAAAPEKKRQFPCRGCGAFLNFSPGAQALKCPYCGSEEKIPQSADEVEELDFEAYRKRASQNQTKTLQDNAVLQKCHGCGAETAFDPKDRSGRCAFCDSPLVDKQAEGREVIKPEGILPFKVNKDQAAEFYQKWIRSRWFAPSDLAQRARRAEINGMYVPFWTYDAMTVTYYTGERGTYYYVTRTYTDSQGRTRTRQERRIRWTPVSGRVDHWFDDVLICASKSLPEKIVDKLEPWDLKALQPFDQRYLPGFQAEYYQIGLEEGFGKARAVMDEAIRQMCRRDIGGDEQRLHSVRTSYSGITFKHILLPTWISAYHYGEKVYRFLVNARTGEVQGERPWSWVKIGLAVLVALAIIALVVFLVVRAQDGQAAGWLPFAPWLPWPETKGVRYIFSRSFTGRSAAS